MIWSFSAGSIATVIVISALELVRTRSKAARQGFSLHVSALAFVLLLSDLPLALEPSWKSPIFHAAQVLIGPVCAATGAYMMLDWLSARARDRMMLVALRAAMSASAVGGLLCFLLPFPMQLPAAGLITALVASVALWMSGRASMLGDRLALGMALGCLLMLVAIVGLFLNALQWQRAGLATQIVAAAAIALSNLVMGLMIWQRYLMEHRVRRDSRLPTERDPVTQLPGSVIIVQKLVDALKRRRRTGRDGAVLAVLLFDLEHSTAQVGPVGLNDVLSQVATRIQRQVGAMNPVGRYYDRCFVVLVETIASPAALRTLGLRIASTLRKPITVQMPHDQVIDVRLDVGVGVVHMVGHTANADAVLHEAEEMAKLARTMRSRAAIADPSTGRPVAVEDADLMTPRSNTRRTRRSGVGSGGGSGNAIATTARPTLKARRQAGGQMV